MIYNCMTKVEEENILEDELAEDQEEKDEEQEEEKKEEKKEEESAWQHTDKGKEEEDKQEAKRKAYEQIEIKRLSYDPDVLMDTIAKFMEEEPERKERLNKKLARTQVKENEKESKEKLE